MWLDVLDHCGGQINKRLVRLLLESPAERLEKDLGGVDWNLSRSSKPSSAYTSQLDGKSIRTGKGTATAPLSGDVS